jgi:TetR/AcrR family transcriptional repressor of nem operon
MGSSKRDKAETHARIVGVAARRFRELGLDGIGVADVMQEAGVTVGGFYKHLHRDAPGTGCALGALVGDMSRASRSARAVYTARFKRSLAYSTGLVPPNGTSDQRARAILMISAMLGAINLSRAVSDPHLSREILQQTRDQLIRLTKRR